MGESPSTACRRAGEMGAYSRDIASSVVAALERQTVVYRDTPAAECGTALDHACRLPATLATPVARETLCKIPIAVSRVARLARIQRDATPQDTRIQATVSCFAQNRTP